MIRAYKYRIYPNEEQARLIRSNCGAARFVYNYALGYYLDEKKKTEESFDLSAIDITIPDLNEENVNSGIWSQSKLNKKTGLITYTYSFPFPYTKNGEALRITETTKDETKTRSFDICKVKGGDESYVSINVKLSKNKLKEIGKVSYVITGKTLFYDDYSIDPVIRNLKNVPGENGDYPYAWIKDVDSILIGYALGNLKTAFDNMYKTGAGFPNFKKKDNSGSYHTQNNSGSIWVEDGKLKLPKIDPVRIKLHRPLDGKIKGVIVSYTPAGTYYAAISQDIPDDKILSTNNGGELGIDVGLKEFYADSNGNFVANPKFAYKMSKKLKKEQRKLSRMERSHITGYKVVGDKRYPEYDTPLRDCKNYQKQRLKIAKLHERIANQREYQHNVESTKIAKENALVCMETLNIKNMQKNHKLARAISDAGWFDFKSKVAYKVKDHGGVFVPIETSFPSSQLCSCCGYRNTKTKDLGVRKWTCPSCGTLHNRDVNAGKNILARGKEILEK